MKVLRTGVALAAGLSLAAPSAATAVTKLYSYNGSDFSVNSTSGKAIDACDRESDFHQVRADWQRTGSGTLQSTINDRGDGTCQRGYPTTVVYKHRIVENKPAVPDEYGPWVYPT